VSTEAGRTKISNGGKLVPSFMPTCGCCGSFDHSEVGHKRGWILRQCKNCDVFFVLPQPRKEELARIYSGKTGYYATAAISLEKAPGSPAHFLAEILERAGVKGGRFLDFGCSNGHVVSGMLKLGWHAIGIDMNPETLTIARRHGLQVVLGDVEAQPFLEGAFDAINMGDILEHVISPAACLRAAKRLLRPGGVVVINTPNSDCGFARSSLFLTRAVGFPWPHSEAPYHLYEFNPMSLTVLLQNLGYTIEVVRRYGRRGFRYTVGASGYFDELKKRLKRKGRYRFDRSLVGSLPMLVIVASVLLPFYLYGILSDRLNDTGCNLTVVARA
jgi:SAM-dependent methyltransferase